MNIIRRIYALFLVLLVATIAYINYFIEYNPALVKILHSAIILLTAYVSNIFVESLINKRIHKIKERYTARKAISTIISIFIFGAILAVWFQETTTLVVAYGILSAGVAIALQDLLKNIAGGIIFVPTGAAKAGDRIQVEKEIGDVLDINILYIAIMDIQEWVDGD